MNELSNVVVSYKTCASIVWPEPEKHTFVQKTTYQRAEISPLNSIHRFIGALSWQGQTGPHGEMHTLRWNQSTAMPTFLRPIELHSP